MSRSQTILDGIGEGIKTSDDLEREVQFKIDGLRQALGGVTPSGVSAYGVMTKITSYKKFFKNVDAVVKELQGMAM